MEVFEGNGLQLPPQASLQTLNKIDSSSSLHIFIYFSQQSSLKYSPLYFFLQQSLEYLLVHSFFKHLLGNMDHNLLL